MRFPPPTEDDDRPLDVPALLPDAVGQTEAVEELVGRLGDERVPTIARVGFVVDELSSKTLEKAGYIHPRGHGGSAFVPEFRSGAG